MGRGIAIALLSGFAFAMSGPFGKPLLAAGWSPAGVVLVRIWIAAIVTLIPMLIVGRARLATLRYAPFTVLAYGLLAVIGVLIVGVLIPFAHSIVAAICAVFVRAKVPVARRRRSRLAAARLAEPAG